MGKKQSNSPYFRIRHLTFFDDELELEIKDTHIPDKNGLYGFYNDFCLILDSCTAFAIEEMMALSYERAEQLAVKEILKFYFKNSGCYRESFNQVCRFVVDGLGWGEDNVRLVILENNILQKELVNA